jgi:hypothetical protein
MNWFGSESRFRTHQAKALTATQKAKQRVALAPSHEMKEVSN